MFSQISDSNYSRAWDTNPIKNFKAQITNAEYKSLNCIEKFISAKNLNGNFYIDASQVSWAKVYWEQRITEILYPKHQLQLVQNKARYTLKIIAIDETFEQTENFMPCGEVGIEIIRTQ